MILTQCIYIYHSSIRKFTYTNTVYNVLKQLGSLIWFKMTSTRQITTRTNYMLHKMQNILHSKPMGKCIEYKSSTGYHQRLPLYLYSVLTFVKFDRFVSILYVFTAACRKRTLSSDFQTNSTYDTNITFRLHLNAR